MLEIVLPEVEYWDERKQEFMYLKEQKLQLEHSLVSLRKWESKWCKPFLGKGEKTPEETLDYIKCMTITQNVKPETYDRLTKKHIDQIVEYIGAPMTATTFSKLNERPSREVITAELIYYWMIALNINWECQKWHLNQLLTLVRVCNIKNEPPKKRSKRDIINQYSDINKARRQQLNSKG